jgi:hypothetical protein
MSEELKLVSAASRRDTVGSVGTTALDPQETSQARQRRKKQERRGREQLTRQRVELAVGKLLLENEDGR